MRRGIIVTRTFIQTTEFTKSWCELGLSDEKLRALENEILRNPKSGSVIRGTGKLRKLRLAFEDRGKSGSVRVCYVDFLSKGTIYLITVFSKNQKDNLTLREKNNIKKIIEILECSL